MKGKCLSHLALCIEYEHRYGGAQRLASILSKKLKKPLHFIGKGSCKIRCWDIKPINKIPSEKILLSIVVNKFTPISIHGKIHLKFMHSAGTIEYLLRRKDIKDYIWITHRKRVYKYGKSLGLKIYLVKNGYILYDKNKLPTVDLKGKKETLCSISRISQSKKILEIINTVKKVSLPLYLIGSIDSLDFSYSRVVEKLIRKSRFPIHYFINISERMKEKILLKCKVLLHFSEGKLRDHFEYSILDAMLFGVVPVCFTPDEKQFEIIKRRKLGLVVNELSEVPIAIETAIREYEYFFNQDRKFMKEFITKQPTIFKSYLSTLKKIIKKLNMNHKI